VDEYDRNEREDLIVTENILENKFNNSDEFEELILDKESEYDKISAFLLNIFLCW
jgi:hypothetical protein